MKIPRWYLVECLIWLGTGLPFQFLFTDFNGIPFFSMPDLPGGNGPSVGQWMFLMALLYHPALMAPVALWHSWTSRTKVK